MKEQAGAALLLGPGPAYFPDFRAAHGMSPWGSADRYFGGWMSCRPWGQMVGIKGQAVRTIPRMMGAGTCWLEAPQWIMGRGS